MGRQTSTALSEADEEAMLAFLRADADVQIYRWTAPSSDQLPVSVFPPREGDDQHFLLWNTAFPWQPEFGSRQARESPGAEPRPEFYVSNRFGSPLVEYTRHPLHDPRPVMHGRLYWNTDFATYHGPEYDHEAFRRWYDHIIRWIRKNGIRVRIAKGWSQYWLPDAWRERGGDSNNQMST